jgi:broad specificity phosphatase PhoE
MCRYDDARDQCRHGESEAIQLGKRLEGLAFASVLTSPLQRAVRTCELAGFGPAAEVEPDLLEWNYGTREANEAKGKLVVRL